MLMRSGDFVKTETGRVWVVAFPFRVLRTRALPDLPKGEHAFCMRAVTKENGVDTLLTMSLPREEALSARMRAREINRANALEGEWLTFRGEPVWIDWTNPLRDFLVARPSTGPHLFPFRWEVALERFRGRPITPGAVPRAALPGEI